MLPGVCAAQSVEDFYRGKTVTVIIGYPPAGANNLYARLVSQHIGKHIPGRPTVITRNMPGGGSLIAANHIFNVAPKDGTTLGLIVPTAPIEERIGVSNIRFRSAKFNWIGRLAPTLTVTTVMANTGVTSIEQVMTRETVLGASGRSSTGAIHPTVLNHIVGTKFKVVVGYKGSAGSMLAMERGEIEGQSTTWDGVKASRSHWLRDKTINVLVQYGLKRHPELLNVPTSVELGKTDNAVKALRMFASSTEIGRLVLSTPDTPAERIRALRRAFDVMVKDPEFLAEATKVKLALDPLTGEGLQHIVAEVMGVSPEIVEWIRGVYPAN
jgi:tripartite-type tricarboxylate transporter receptor subunit TctC